MIAFNLICEVILAIPYSLLINKKVYPKPDQPQGKYKNKGAYK